MRLPIPGWVRRRADRQPGETAKQDVTTAEHQGPWSSLPPPPPSGPLRRPATNNLRGLIFLGIIVAGAVLVFALTKLYPNQIKGDDWTAPLINLGFAAMVASALFSRRIPLGHMARYIAIWGLVFAVLAIGYVYRDDFIGMGSRIHSALDPSHALQTGAHSVTLTESEGGQYEVMGEVNGQPVRFMIDTGASDIVLSPADAARLGAPVSTLKFDRHYETANGAGLGADWQATNLAVGPIRFANVPVSVNQAPMSQSLLGMSFLHRLDSFEFKGRQLILRGAPKTP
jgi:aspartyl protease family protein